MDVNIEPSWKALLSAEFDKPYFTSLVQFVRNEYQTGVCYPPGHLIFNAFWQTPLSEVKVVILGQDPYHGPGQAHGLCFSVSEGVAFPPSLRNIFQEIQTETGAPIPASGDLTRWARQGVFLLNTCLSVRQHQAFRHGLGDIYRCRHQGHKRYALGRCIPALGSSGRAQGKAY